MMRADTKGRGENIQGKEDEGLVGLLLAAGQTRRGVEVAVMAVVVLGSEDECREPAGEIIC
jgi:late competence protein required for DNA uptake (superfamily II DNA/RNA helicase)